MITWSWTTTGPYNNNKSCNLTPRVDSVESIKWLTTMIFFASPFVGKGCVVLINHIISSISLASVGIHPSIHPSVVSCMIWYDSRKFLSLLLILSPTKIMWQPWRWSEFVIYYISTVVVSSNYVAWLFEKTIKMSKCHWQPAWPGGPLVTWVSTTSTKLTGGRIDHQLWCKVICK